MSGGKSSSRESTGGILFGAISVQLKMSERLDDLVSRRARGVFGPPGKDVGPHADDGLGENIGIETIATASDGDGLAASRAHAARQAFENPSADLAGLSTWMKHDPQQISLVFREADECFGLRLHEFDRIGDVLCDRVETIFEFDRGLIGQLAEEGELVLEVEIKRASPRNYSLPVSGI